MATMPNLNPTDPWTLTQKFLDQTAKENERKEYYAAMLEAESIKAQAKGAALSPYEKQRQKNEADLEFAEKADKAGFTGGRYRRPKAGGTGKTGAYDKDIFNEFMEGVKEGGLTNPYGLAVVAGTGQVESGFSKGNLHRKWEDRSEKGVTGTSGLLMSWRDGEGSNRLSKAIQFGKSRGEDMPSARTQGHYTAIENPEMTQKLQNAGSLAEAQKIINSYWRFAGWERGGGSTNARLEASAAHLKNVGGSTPTARSLGEMKTADAQSGQSGTLKVDEKGKEYWEVRYPPNTIKQIAAGMPNARTRFVPDDTKPWGPKGERTYRAYSGRTGAPNTTVADATGAPPAPGTTPAAPTAPATAPATPAIVAPPVQAATPLAPILAPPTAMPAPALQKPTTGMVKANGYSGDEEEEEEEEEEE